MIAKSKLFILGKQKSETPMGCTLKDGFIKQIEYVTHRQKKQKPQIDFLWFLCYNKKQS